VQYRIHALPGLYWGPRLLSTAKESWREHMWCLRQLHSLSPWKGARRGARVVAPDPILWYLGVALCTSTHFRCGLGSNEDDGVSSRFGDCIPIGNFWVKARGCWGCSQWEEDVERNLGRVASMASGLYIRRYKHPPYIAIDILCLCSTTGLEPRFRNCTALRLGRRQCV
jgi:hypothetical protein